MSVARKRFGQHFLHDGNVIRKIVAAIDPVSTDRIVEIGPGRGAITRPLLALVAQLDAIEIDRDLAASLPHLPGAERLTVHAVDVLKFDFRSLNTGPGELRLVGNLPYNISTPLLFHLLDCAELFRDIHVMLQREVGERICALPGNKTYGRLTIGIASRCRAEKLFGIKPGSFAPPPNVDSVFLRLTPLPRTAIKLKSQATLDALVTRAFTMRRKRLANALGEYLAEAEIRAAGIDPDLRPENLSPADFIRLANLLP